MSLTETEIIRTRLAELRNSFDDQIDEATANAQELIDKAHFGNHMTMVLDEYAYFTVEAEVMEQVINWLEPVISEIYQRLDSIDLTYQDTVDRIIDLDLRIVELENELND